MRCNACWFHGAEFSSPPPQLSTNGSRTCRPVLVEALVEMVGVGGRLDDGDEVLGGVEVVGGDGVVQLEELEEWFGFAWEEAMVGGCPHVLV